MMDNSKPEPASGLHAMSLASLRKILAERWKGVTVSVVLVVGTIGFTQIEVTGGARQNVIESFYQTVRLFVLGADGMPTGGPVTWLVIMWCLYLLAPALTATFLVESIRTIKQAVVNPDRVVRGMKNHLILCGLGKHGRLIVRQVCARNPGQRVVVVDIDPSLPPFLEFGTDDAAPTDGPPKTGSTSSPTETNWMSTLRGFLSHRDDKVPVIVGDMTDRLTLRRAGIERACRLFAASGNDVANLNACLLAKEFAETPGFKAVAMISDVDLSRGVSELARRQAIVLINPYEIAAKNLVEKFWPMREPSNAGPALVVVAGFGRFGQMFTKALLAKAGRGSSLRVAVVDRVATKKVEAFRRNFHIPDGTLSAVDGDVDDPRVFETALARSVCATSEAEAMVVLCTDNDTANLNTALLLQEHWGVHATVVTRLFNPPPRFCDLIEGSRIHPFQIPELIEKGLPAECF